MSLQVWLPLNGNLNNQGLSDVTVVNNGATVDSNGKIGSCYLVNSDKKIFFTSFPWMTMKPQYDFSCFFWVKGTTTGWLFACGAWEFRLRTDFIQVHPGPSGSYPARYTATFDNNTWYHLGFTWSGAEGKLRLYMNGSLVATSDVPSTASYDIYSTFNIPYDGPRYINDFRLYDHCLSSKEIKEISKGLICHYKLNGKGFGNPNLITTMSSGGRTTLNGKYGLSADFSQNADTYGYFNVSPALELNKAYTLSFDVSNLPDGASWGWMLWNNYNYTLPTVNKNGHYVYTFTPDSSKLPSNYSLTKFLFDDGGRVNPVGMVYFTNFKIEEGTKATPWCPHTSDTFYTSLGLNSTTESDDSGYKYDGTLSEPLSLVSGSPRYGECYYFNSTSKRITLPTISMTGFANSFSISWWGKAPSYSSLMYWGFSNGNRLNYYDGKYCNTGDGGSNPYYKPNTTTTIDVPSVNVWHHFVMVGDGSTNKLYMDGALYGVAKTYKGITGSSIVINGWDSSTNYKTNGYISDFRIYSTALSAEDVKELYNTPASIDKSGNIYAYEFREE